MLSARCLLAGRQSKPACLHGKRRWGRVTWPRCYPAALPFPALQTSIYLATSAEVEGVSGKYYDKSRPVSSSKESYDRGVAERLWAVSSELVGL